MINYSENQQEERKSHYSLTATCSLDFFYSQSFNILSQEKKCDNKVKNDSRQHNHGELD